MQKNSNKIISPRDESGKGYLDYTTTESTPIIVQGRGGHFPFSRYTNTNVNTIATKLTGLIGAVNYTINPLLF